MIFRKKYFTLLEFLIIIGIISLIAGFITINIRRALKEQHFKSEVEVLVNQFRLAQDLMLIFRGEVLVKIGTLPDDKGLYTKLEFEAPMPGNWSHETKRIHKLTHIKELSFPDKLDEDVNVSQDTNLDSISIKFRSNGSQMSQAIMSLHSSTEHDSENITRYINMRGYPAPIYSQTALPTQDIADDEAYNNTVTARTAAEVQFLRDAPADNEKPEELVEKPKRRRR